MPTRGLSLFFFGLAQLAFVLLWARSEGKRLADVVTVTWGWEPGGSGGGDLGYDDKRPPPG